MGKKIMKRSLALGALMAFVITGSAMAAEDKIFNDNVNTNAGNVEIVGNNVTFNDSITATNNNSSIKVTADNDLIINTKSDVRAAYAKAKNTSISLKAGNNIVINGKVFAVADHDGSNIYNGNLDIAGKTIKINVVGDKKAVHAANLKGENGKGVAVLNLGDSNTELIEINTTANDTVFHAYRNNTTINVNAKDVLVTDNSAKEMTYAVYANNGTYVDSDGAENNAKVIFGENTNLSVDLYKQDGESKVATGSAIVAHSQGRIDIPGNVYVSAENSVMTRGESTIDINKSGKSVVQLNGNIEFYADRTDRMDSNVKINLNGSKSYLNGKIYTHTYDLVNDVEENIVDSNNEDGRVKGMKLGLSNGATWNVTGDSFVNELSGSGGNIVFDANAKDVHVDAGTASLNLTMKDKTADDLNDAAGLTTVAQRLGVKEEAIKTISAKVVMAEGDIKGETTGVVKYKSEAEEGYYHGYVAEESVTEKVNTKNQAIGDAGISLKLHWRAHINDMNKRMGELRNAEGEHGVWARMVRGESEYKNTKAQYNQYQLGYDEKLSVDNRWTVGAAVTFAEGDANYGQGSTDDKSTAFAIYGSKLNNDGTFVDLIARYAHLESDLDDANSGKGDYATNGMSVSAEFGKRIQKGNGLWVEPQVELTYGTIDSAEFKFDSGKTVNVGDMDSLIGRVGFRIGKDLEQGNVYARASYLYDFDGETENAFSNATDSRTIAEDLGGGWWEVGVGANINLSKATYVYADVEKTFGGEVDTNWQWNLGVRYSF